MHSTVPRSTSAWTLEPLSVPASTTAVIASAFCSAGEKHRRRAQENKIYSVVPTVSLAVPVKFSVQKLSPFQQARIIYVHLTDKWNDQRNHPKKVSFTPPKTLAPTYLLSATRVPLDPPHVPPLVFPSPRSFMSAVSHKTLPDKHLLPPSSPLASDLKSPVDSMDSA